MKRLRIKIRVFFILVIGLLLNGSINAEEEQNLPETTPAGSLEKLSVKFSTSIELLSKNTKADDVLWIDVKSNKHLVLWHRGKGRKERGNVLLLHAQGENAEHIRLIQPLAKQLVHLGWNLFIPNIAQEDFPKPVITNGEKENSDNLTDTDGKTSPEEQANTSQQETNNKTQTDSKNELFFFKNSQDYQDYFLLLYQAIFEQTEIAKLPTIIIANQNAAYWSLKCLDNKQLTPIVFLQPQLPDGVSNNLDDIFALQTNPLFSFHLATKNTNIFNTSFKKRLWRSKFQRFNTGMLSSSKLQEEDTVIAKTITGWVEKQRKK